MSSSHTRKRPGGAWRISAACLLGFGLSLVSHAADLAPLVQRVVLQNTSANESPRMMLHGTAPLHCAPEVARVTLDGSDLSIELTAPQTGCDSVHLRPFALPIEPAASTGTPLLPGQVYRVRVYATNAGSATLIAFHLLDTSRGTAAPRPENGYWWSQASAETGAAVAGTGASLELQDGQLAVGLFGFSDSGAPIWYFGSTRAEGRTAQVALVGLVNGDPLFAPAGAQPTALAGPRLELEFLSPTQARGWLVQNEAGRDTRVRSLMLGRTHFSGGPTSAAWSGQWVLVADDKGPPRLFEFAEPSSRDADTFHLSDAANDASLDCRLVAEGAQHPDICTLSVASVPLADFDQVGLDHLSGRGSNGGLVKLVRVPR